MPRQITHLVTVQPAVERGEGTRGGNGRFDKQYKGTGSGPLVAYLTAKYGILPMYTRAMLHDIFRYIEMETLAGGGSITIPRFGRFVRREYVSGPGTVATALRLERNARETYIDFEDEEWVDDE